jgi:hypothetical protein
MLNWLIITKTNRVPSAWLMGQRPQINVCFCFAPLPPLIERHVDFAQNLEWNAKNGECNKLATAANK